jgi:hypothetical protein
LTCLECPAYRTSKSQPTLEEDFIVELGPFGGPDVRLRINREPPVTAIVLWTPTAEQQDCKDELMQVAPTTSHCQMVSRGGWRRRSGRRPQKAKSL